MKTILSILLLVSIGINVALYYEVTNIGVKYELPQFSEAEQEVLSKAIGVIGNDYPLGTYPFEVERSGEGYILKFREFVYLQVLKSPFRDSTITDGCVYFLMNKYLSEYEKQPCG